MPIAAVLAYCWAMVFGILSVYASYEFHLLRPMMQSPYPGILMHSFTQGQRSPSPQIAAKSCLTLGAIHLWRPDEGGQAQVDACGRGEGVKPHVDVQSENQN